MSPFENLSTPRLTLRRLSKGDQKGIFELRSSEIVARYIDRPILQDESGATAFIERIQDGYASGTAYYWVLSLKGGEELIGTICLWNFSADNAVAEIGYELLPEHHGKGYMQEAVAAISEYSFNTLQLTAIEAFTHMENVASRNLLERNGFTLCEGRTDTDVAENVVYRKDAMKG